MESQASPPGRAGTYVRQPTGYIAFHPASFPPRDLDLSAGLITAPSRADQAFARFDGAASVTPNVELFLTMYVRDEATRWSQIEGTQATLADGVEAEVSHLDSERRDAVAEIKNSVATLDTGLRRPRPASSVAYGTATLRRCCSRRPRPAPESRWAITRCLARSPEGWPARQVRWWCLVSACGSSSSSPTAGLTCTSTSWTCRASWSTA